MDTWVEVPTSAGPGIVVPVLMDLADYKALAGRSLSIGSHGYAQMWNLPQGVCLLHRWIMGIPPGTRYAVVVDHINHDILDCRRTNLRVVSPTGSNLNRRVRVRDLPVGVYRSPSGRFSAKLKRHRVMHNLGTFDTVEQARNVVVQATYEYDRKFIPDQERRIIGPDFLVGVVTAQRSGHPNQAPPS